MIALMFTGKCENCKCADLELIKPLALSSIDNRAEWSVYCKHQYACGRVAEWTRKTLKGKGETDD